MASLTYQPNPRTSSVTDMDKDKTLYKEEAASIVEAAPLPPTLQGLSKEEIRVLEKKLVRRIDLRLLPMLVIMYILNYLDRNNIAAAKLAGKLGMQKELHMTTTQFSVCRDATYNSKHYLY